MKVTPHQLMTLHNTEAYNRSDKYTVVKTIDVVNTLKERGFTVADYQESRVRKEEKKNKMKHFVRMKIDTDGIFDREIVIMNSHDGSSSLKLNFGGFRAVCNNQLVFGDKLLPTESIYHSVQNPWDRINNYVDRAMAALEEEREIREAMMKKHLTALQTERFYHRAIALKEDDKAIILDPMSVGIIRRPEDAGKTIWNTFNRVQENLIQGDSYRKLGFNYDEHGAATEVYKVAKKVSDNKRAIDINKKLYDLALEYV